MSSTSGGYYLPQPSHWPLVGSLGLFVTTLGLAMSLPIGGNELNPTVGPLKDDASVNGYIWVMFAGMAIIFFMMYGWFSTVVRESEGGKYNEQVDRSFRMSMGWFIFSEVMFFAAFFGALFYVRTLVFPQITGTETNEALRYTHLWLYSHTEGLKWPLGIPGTDAGSMLTLIGPKETAVVGKSFKSMHAWWIPTVNTLILLTSSVTVTIAHHALRAGHRAKLNLWLLITIILGFIFVGMQAFEYYEAYAHYNLTLKGGAYGYTFFMLTGFHGLHVTIGATILLFIYFRCLKGHFTSERHFAFEAAAWYWHFVDVVWVGLFIFVYLL